MYIPNGINTGGIKTNYLTAINGTISKLTSNYSNILQLYTNSITLNGNMVVTGNVTINGNINISGLTILDDLEINGNLTVNGTTSLSDLDVSGNLTVRGMTNLYDLDVSGNHTVHGTTSLYDLDVSGNLTVHGTTKLGTSLIYTDNLLTDVSGIIAFNKIVTFLDASGSAYNTLPTAPENNLVKILVSTHNNTTIVETTQGNFLDTSGNTTMATFNTIGQSLTLLSAGNNWVILSNYGDVQFS